MSWPRLQRPTLTPATTPRAHLAIILARLAQELARLADEGVEGARQSRDVLHALATIVHHGAWDALPGIATAAKAAVGDLDLVHLQESRVTRPGLLDTLLPPGPKRTLVLIAVAVFLFLLTLIARSVAPGS